MRVAPLNVLFASQSAVMPLDASARVLTPQKPDSVRLAGKNAPKFGCRLFAYMNAAEQPGQENILRTCLLDGKNSLRHQSTPRHPKMDAANVLSWEDQPFLPVHKDGWGVVSYAGDNPEPWITKKMAGASTDKGYEEAVNTAIAQKPHTLLGHIRSATVGGINEDNVHPFQFGNWTFMHNGGLFGQNIADVREKVAETYAPQLGEGPRGQTDSEAVFYYTLGKLYERYPDLAQLKSGLQDIPPNELHEAFNSVVHEMSYSGKNDMRPYPLNRIRIARETGLNFTNDSTLNVSPATNYVLTNGKVMLSAAYGHKLFLGVRHKPEKPKGNAMRDVDHGNAEVLIASEPMQPRGWFSRNKIRWTEVQPGHSVMLVRDPDGVKVTTRAF